MISKASKKKSPLPFPKLMIHPDGEIILAIRDVGQDMVFATVLHQSRDGGARPLGFTNEVHVGSFIDFDGSVTISNQ